MKKLKCWIALLSSAALLSSGVWIDAGNAKPSHAKGKGKPTEAIASPQSSTAPEWQNQNQPNQGRAKPSKTKGKKKQFSLPPGVQKKLSRGKKMPPGIAKKMQLDHATQAR